jgi:serine/threonine protein kinase
MPGDRIPDEGHGFDVDVLDATRIDAVPTRLEVPRTRLDAGSHGPGLTNLPLALAGRYTVVRSFKTASSEADLLLVRTHDEATFHVAKVYRYGVNPKSEILDAISRSNPEHVVTLIEHDMSSERYYELLEYMPLGSLRDVFPPGCRVDDAALKQVVRELNDALQHLHQQGIIHRDLKPANILVRTLEPLDLVLTDFGIASRSEATAHYTNAHRTVAYAAPETIAGEVSFASDYWSLGIIIAELVAGSHPLAGMTEFAIAGALIKQSVPIDHLAPPWRLLCTGLLQRSPSARWRYPEVERWLAGDTTLMAPDPELAPPVEATTPYKFGKKLHHSAVDLAGALVADPEEAQKHLARGYVSAWIARELNDHDLASYVDDCTERYVDAPDLLLLAVSARMAPGLNASFRGLRMAVPEILACALEASKRGGKPSARELIEDLHRHNVLEIYALASGNGPIREAARTWRDLMKRFDAHLDHFATVLGMQQATSAGSTATRGALLAAAIDPKTEVAFRRHARSMLDDARYASAFNSQRFTRWLSSQPRDAAAVLVIAVFLEKVAADQALINAARRSYIDVSGDLEAALLMGADPARPDDDGSTALHWIAERAATPALIPVLLAHGGPLEAVDRQGRTPLMVAASKNDTPEIARMLVERGARREAVDPANATALDLGRARGAPASVLVAVGPDPEPRHRNPIVTAQSPGNAGGCMGTTVVALVTAGMLLFIGSGMM